MKLYESLQQLFRQYGHGILEEESIVTKLTGLRAFDGSPALRDAMKCLSENGCLKELLIRSRRNIASDFALYTGYLRKSLEESWHFDHDTALLAVDSLSFALGHTASEPGTAPAAPATGGESAGESHRVNISEYNYIQQDTVSASQNYNENEKDTSEGIDSDIINDGKPISFLRCFSYRVTWAFIFGKFMTEGAWWFYLFWAPIYISDTYGYTTDSPMGMALIFTIYLISMLSVIGGYLPTYLTEEFSLTPLQARLRAMLGFACLQLIGLLQMPLGSHSPWVLVIIIGIFGAAHQSWSANLFSLVGDNIPKKSIATVIGIGGCAGGIASYLVMVFTGALLQYAEQMHDTFTFLGYSGKAAAYMMMFSIFSVSYLIGWGIIRLLSDYHKSTVRMS